MRLKYAYGTTALERRKETEARRRESATYTGYTSTASAISISLNVTPLGGSTTNTVGTCAPAGGGTSGTCTATFSAAPGPTTISATLTELGNTIATFSKLVIVQPTTPNTIAFTANPVVTSANVILASTTINAGTAANILVTVNALDANGNIIAGTTPYVDSNGNPVVFTLSAQTTQTGGRGIVTFQGPTAISGPSQALTYLQYNGGWLSQATVNVASSSSAVTTLTANTLTTTPFAKEFSTPNGAQYIVTGPDGNLWITEWGNSGIAKLTPDGVYTQYACAACNGTHGIANGPDGNIWFNEANANEIGKITTSGVITRLAPLAGGTMLVAAPDGNLWSGTGNTVISKITTSGTVTSYIVGNGTRGITVGPDGNIWYVDSNTHMVGVFSLSGYAIASYSIPALSSSSDGIITGPDGNVWVGNNGSNLIYRITPTGAITTYTLQVNAHPRAFAVGPDGYLWFTEQGTNSIGRISMSGVVTEYGAAYGISAASAPVGITVGPDGNIWFTENGLNRVAKFVL